MNAVECWWIFTFGCGQQHAGRYVRIWGTFDEARRKMFEKFGREWSVQYSEVDWNRMKNDPNRKYAIETEMEVIDNESET